MNDLGHQFQLQLMVSSLTNNMVFDDASKYFSNVSFELAPLLPNTSPSRASAPVFLLRLSQTLKKTKKANLTVPSLLRLLFPVVSYVSKPLGKTLQMRSFGNMTESGQQEVSKLCEDFYKAN